MELNFMPATKVPETSWKIADTTEEYIFPPCLGELQRQKGEDESSYRAAEGSNTEGFHRLRGFPFAGEQAGWTYRDIRSQIFYRNANFSRDISRLTEAY